MELGARLELGEPFVRSSRNVGEAVENVASDLKESPEYATQWCCVTRLRAMHPLSLTHLALCIKLCQYIVNNYKSFIAVLLY